MVSIHRYYHGLVAVPVTWVSSLLSMQDNMVHSALHASLRQTVTKESINNTFRVANTAEVGQWYEVQFSGEGALIWYSKIPQ